MPLKIICAGYVDADEVKHECGTFIGTLLSSNDGITHGLCTSCEKKALEAADQLEQRTENVE